MISTKQPSLRHLVQLGNTRSTSGKAMLARSKYNTFHDCNNWRGEANWPVAADKSMVTFLKNVTKASFQAVGREEELKDLLNRMDNGTLSCCPHSLRDKIG